MNRRSQKKEVFTVLQKSTWQEVIKYLDQYTEKHLINHLFSAICSTNMLCKWNAINSFGYIVPQMAQNDPESARIVMRRFLWSLNDESGGIGWGAPESMAEVMANSDLLFDEYSHMLLSYTKEDGPELCQDGNFIELPALQQGVMWGVARLLASKNEKMITQDLAHDLVQYLESEDKIVQALALFGLSKCCSEKEFAVIAEKYSEDTFSFILYWDYSFKEVHIFDIARKNFD